jgi:hypothetical protein
MVKMVTAIKLFCFFVLDVAWYLKEQFGIKRSMELANIQMAQRKKKINIDSAAEQGASAFRDNKSHGDNPFDFESQRELFDAWRDGFINEKQWWGE